MTKPRKHHFIPQFYLRGFSLNGGHLYQIDRHSGNCHGVSISDAAAMRDFHTLDSIGNGDAYEFERKLAHLESKQALDLANILREGIENEENIINAIQFLNIMRMRVPAIKEIIENSLIGQVKASYALLKRAGKLPQKPEELKELPGADDIKISIHNERCLLHMIKAGTNEGIISSLQRMNISLLRAPFGCRFITCDQPVAMYHPNPILCQKGVGTTTPGVEITLPLSSRFLVKLYNGHKSPVEYLATSGDVAELNRRTMCMAKNYIYTGEYPEIIRNTLPSISGISAGCKFESFDGGKEFVQGLRWTAIPPAI